MEARKSLRNESSQNALEITTLMNLNLASKYHQMEERERKIHLDACVRCYHDNIGFNKRLLSDIILSSLSDFTFETDILVDFIAILKKGKKFDNIVKTLDEVCEAMQQIEEDVPGFIDKIAYFLALAIQKKIIGLRSVAVVSTMHPFSAILLKVLQTMKALMGEAELMQAVAENSITRYDMQKNIPEDCRGNGKMEEILQKMDLECLLVNNVRPHSSRSKDMPTDAPNSDTEMPPPPALSSGEKQGVTRKRAVVKQTFQHSTPARKKKSKTRLQVNAKPSSDTADSADQPDNLFKKPQPKNTAVEKKPVPRNQLPEVIEINDTLSNIHSQSLIQMQHDISRAIASSRIALIPSRNKIKVTRQFYDTEIEELHKIEKELKCIMFLLGTQGEIFVEDKLQSYIDVLFNQIEVKNELIQRLEVV